jgi:hypothetical protein
MSLTNLLVAGAIALYVAVRVGTSLAAKGGAGKKWQLWMLGEPRGSRVPHRDDIVM